MNDHEETSVNTLGGKSIRVDSGLAPVVAELANHGVAVESGCQGDDDFPVVIVCLGGLAALALAHAVKTDHLPYRGVAPTISDYTTLTATPVMPNRFGVQYALGRDFTTRITFSMPASGLESFTIFLKSIKLS